ncbi:bifunctional riboflavin kinase/FAD synthetase [Candidatus Anaplasma sp. TIGMIC]|uniref:bifunctional riboflavin kinase/FAD synthetase n=1 Tax=Candidatus Anaplasma sp. TIGMIC TaxID=3020713 RepID=UPI00232CD3C9|nr:bifunctional riboflavin kinase/FAD synthetase [Candidatus Anaplasma sp. TIGMIC]MDB1135324.1 bifunctional riboflavin kinase/FAD synthetase [Candidatus Anaplasma sp. TIGMIC]
MEVLYGRPGAKEVVLTFGNFDGVHKGHVHVFREVVRLARMHNLASAVLTFSPHTATVVRNREQFLLIDFERKVNLIADCGIEYLHVVEFCPSFAAMSPTAFIEDILVKRCMSKYVVVGTDCVFGRRCEGNLSTLHECAKVYGYEVVSVAPLTDDSGIVYSSSAVRECVENGDMRSASLILGRCHSVSGSVMRGSSRGRSIGFPTLNLSMAHTILPRLGVYSARVMIEADVWLQGIVNVGIRPTFSAEEAPILEMHIFDFDQEIYGQKVTIELVDFVRPERKFDSVEQLVIQIKKDIEEVRNSGR